MALIVDLQLATEMPLSARVPERDQFASWVQAALQADTYAAAGATELTIRIVDEAESTALNGQYRGIAAATNVLSFPFELPPGLNAAAHSELPILLGDLVLCAPVVTREAAERNKSAKAHWAHLTVHGTLHLLGHDHIHPTEAARMEMLETMVLRGLGFPQPYEVSQDTHDERPS